MAAPQAFVEHLRQARDATHSKDHPYFRKWAQGELTRQQLGFYTVMHYHFVTEYLNWLAYIARRRAPSQLMILGTYRPVDAVVHNHPVRTVTQELRLHGLCEELVLDYLSATGVNAYLTGRFGTQAGSPDLVELLHQRSQGNPLFLIAMLEAFIRQDIMTHTASGWRVQDTLETAATIVPSSLRQLVEYHLLRLDIADQALLEVASVAGATFSAAAVAAGMAQSEGVAERVALVMNKARAVSEAAVDKTMVAEGVS